MADCPHYITTRHHYDGPPQPGIEALCRCGRTMLARDESHLVVLLAEHRAWQLAELEYLEGRE